MSLKKRSRRINPAHETTESVSSPSGVITRRFVCKFALPAALCALAASTLAAEPKLRQTDVPLRLPRNYEPPAAVSVRSFDQELHVGVVPPVYDRGSNATWLGSFDRVFVNPAESVAAVLPRIFRRLFPGSEILANAHCPTCDLVFIVRTDSGSFIGYDDNVAAVTVKVSIRAVDPNGVTMASFVAEGTGRLTKSIYWSQYTMARAMGEPALQSAIDQVFAKLVNDESLRTFVKERAAERARPSDLETTAVFDDSGSFFPNGRLDAGETARLRFRVENHGAGPAFAVRLRLAATMKAVTTPMERDVGDIPAGGMKEVDVPLLAGLDVETAQQQLRVETLEKRGYGARPMVVLLATEKLTRPTLEIADVRLEDGSGRTHGDGDGLPSNGETLEAVMLLRNTGPGDAAGASMTIAAMPGVQVLEPAASVGAISVNALKEVRALVRIPVTFSAPDFALNLRVVETRGPAVATAERVQRWALQRKQPRIEIGYRLFDGNSPQSRGNHDGVANNGETLEVALVPSNEGTLVARAVRLAVSSSAAGVSISPTTFEIGELPASSEGPEQRVQIKVPRALTGGDLANVLPVAVTVSQADFPASAQLVAIPFAAKQPDLTISVAATSTLNEGKTASFALDLGNAGSLGAEQVEADVTTDSAAMELLDSSGSVAQAIHFDLGAIPAGTAAARIQFRAQIRRNVSSSGGLLKVSLSQRDFAAVVTQMPFEIVPEEAKVVSAIPPPTAQAPASRSVLAPAMVSFQRYRDGNRLADETVPLAFEVQSQAPIEVVRLEQNNRAIDLSAVTPVRTEGGYRWQYEPRVHLDYGDNDFEVVVVTAEGTRSSRSMTLVREKPRGKIWLAVVGVSNYQDPSVRDLEFAKDDAVALGAFYRQLGVPADQVIELLDGSATLANIKRALGTDLVRNAANPDDLVIIYFAGHGEMEPDRSSADADGYSKYLLPHDVNPTDLFGSALSMEEVSRILQRLRADRVVLIIDSCFSGAAGGRTPYEPNAPSRGVISDEFLSRVAGAGRGRVILTASGSREVAQESNDIRHGVFTYYLLEGLRGAADIDHDGHVDIDELYKYVSQKVSLATHGRQNPMRKSPNLTGTIVLGGHLQ